MARQTFGAGLADFVVRPSDGLWGVAGGATVTFWDSSDAGAQYTDLLDATGTPVDKVTADEFGQLPSFSGPDGITGMWADAGGESRAWIEARGGGGGGGGGGPFSYTTLIRVVASATAPADVRAAAAYVCDGTADQVQIEQAIADAQNDGGGIVMLSVGGFNLTAPVEIAGTANEDNPLTVSLMGCGEHATVLKPAYDSQAAIVLTNWAQCHLSHFGIEIMGATSGIVSTAVTTTDTRSFWDSSFRNLRIYGFYAASYTGWAMDLSMPFRSVFENIEVEGTRNGIRLLNDSTVQNAGDCTFTRMFIEIVGDNGVAIHVSSPSNNMNQNNFNMVEAGANGANCTGILIDGAGGGASQRFWGTNLEQFATLINVANGESNVFDLNYVTCDDDLVTGNKAFVCGPSAWGNVFSAKWVNVPSGQTLKVIEDNNNTSNVPNIFERIRIENNGGTVTYSKTNSSVFREITTFNDGGTLQAGLLQYPLSTVNDPSFTPADHGWLSWTYDPSVGGHGGSVVPAGVLHMMRLKIVNRATVVTNLIATLTAPGAGLTAGQCVAGIYDSSGTLLGQTADQSTAWSTIGLKEMPLTAPVTLAVGTYYVALLANGTTTPAFLIGTGTSSSTLNYGIRRYVTSGSSLTALPASVSLAGTATDFVARWAALS